MEKIFGQNSGSSIVHRVRSSERTIIRKFKNFDGTTYTREEQVTEYFPLCGSGTCYTVNKSASICYPVDATESTCERCLKQEA